MAEDLVAISNGLLVEGLGVKVTAGGVQAGYLSPGPAPFPLQSQHADDHRFWRSDDALRHPDAGR